VLQARCDLFSLCVRQISIETGDDHVRTVRLYVKIKLVKSSR